MVDRPAKFNSLPVAPESPGIPEQTGSHPLDFLPATFMTRPRPSYPQRTNYATFDPAFTGSQFPIGSVPLVSSCTNITTNAPTRIERRAGSETHTGWRRRNVARQLSIPPDLEIAPLVLRERPPYPNRSMYEITTWMPPPVVEPRCSHSQPVTRAEILAARPADEPNDWADWAEENNPHRTRWVGYDTSRQAMHGTMEDPNETAALPNESVLESIEVEGDPLIALRYAINNSQAIIRRQLDNEIVLQDDNRALIGRNSVLEENVRVYSERTRHLERTRQHARDDLTLTEEERDLARRERDLARSQVYRLRLERDEPEEAYNRRQAQQEEYEQAIESVQGYEQSEATLRADLERVTARIDILQREYDRSEHGRLQLEMERERERDHNQNLQEQVLFLVNTLRAAEPVNASPPTSGSSSVPNPIDPPRITQPTISSPPIAELPGSIPSGPVPSGPVPPGSGPPNPEPQAGPLTTGRRGHERGVARGRGRRGGRGAT